MVESQEGTNDDEEDDEDGEDFGNGEKLAFNWVQYIVTQKYSSNCDLKIMTYLVHLSLMRIW